MNSRRNFLKFVGIGAATAIPISPILEVKKEKTLREKVTEHVIYPEEIVKNPLNHEKLDLNDDVTGIAALLTAQICEKFMLQPENQNITNIKAMLKFSVTQSSFVGLILARHCCRIVIDKFEGPAKVEAIELPEFRVMIKHFGDFLQADCITEYHQYIYSEYRAHGHRRAHEV